MNIIDRRILHQTNINICRISAPNLANSVSVGYIDVSEKTVLFTHILNYKSILIITLYCLINNKM